MAQCQKCRVIRTQDLNRFLAVSGSWWNCQFVKRRCPNRQACTLCFDKSLVLQDSFVVAFRQLPTQDEIGATSKERNP